MTAYIEEIWKLSNWIEGFSSFSLHLGPTWIGSKVAGYKSIINYNNFYCKLIITGMINIHLFNTFSTSSALQVLGIQIPNE